MKINLNTASAENTQDILYIKNFFMPEENFSYADMKALILNENVFEISVDDKIAGIVCITGDISCSPEIKYFFILPEYQNKGIGGFILNNIFSKFYSAGYWSISVPEELSKCIRFFKKFGFDNAFSGNGILEKFEENLTGTAENFFKNPDITKTPKECEEIFSGSMIAGRIFILNGNFTPENALKNLFSSYVLSEKDFSIDEYKEDLSIKPFENEIFWDSFISHISGGMTPEKYENIYRRCHDAKVVQIYERTGRTMFFGWCRRYSFIAEYGLYY